MSNDSKEESRSKEENLYPEKPKNQIDFKKAVAWFGGRELVASLKGVLLYAVFGENIDPRSWMNPTFTRIFWKKFSTKRKLRRRTHLEKELKPENKANGKLHIRKFLRKRLKI